MDIYENIVIGNFLFGLGIEVGRRHAANATTLLNVSLLQQTPLDKKLGDVLLSNQSMFRVLEFKRRKSDLAKEEAKVDVLSRALTAPTTCHLQTVSRDIHWYIETVAQGGQLETRILPYLDLKLAGQTAPDAGLIAFISLTADSAYSTPPKENYGATCREYLNLLIRMSSDQSSSSTSGYLIVELSNAGEIRYLVVNDLRDLSLTLENVLKREELHQLQSLKQTLKQTLKRGQGIER